MVHDFERWPEFQGTVCNSKKRRVRNACDMSSQAINHGRYAGAPVGFVNGEVEYLVRGKVTICEGQHTAGLLGSTVGKRRSPSPVQMVRMTARPASPGSQTQYETDCSHDTKDFDPLVGYKHLKPRPVAHRFPQAALVPTRASGKEPPQTPTSPEADHDRGSFGDARSPPTRLPPPLPRAASPFAKTIGRDSPVFFGTGQLKERGTGSAVQKAATEKEKRDEVVLPADTPEYKEQLRNISSISDYYEVVRLWDVAEQKLMRANHEREADSKSAQERRGLGDADALRAAAFMKVGWSNTPAGDKGGRLRRRKSKGHDFTSTPGRSSPMFFFTENEANDLMYSRHRVLATPPPVKAKQALGAHTGRPGTGPGGRTLNLEKIVKRHKQLKQRGDSGGGVGAGGGSVSGGGGGGGGGGGLIAGHSAANRLNWTNPEYWEKNPSKGGPITFQDDFSLNPSALTTNIRSYSCGPPPLGVHRGRESLDLGTQDQRNRLKHKVCLSGTEVAVA